MTLRMRITLLTGVIIIMASALMTASSIYMAQNKILQATVQAVRVTAIAEPVNVTMAEIKEGAVAGKAIEAATIIPLSKAEAVPMAKVIELSKLPAQNASKEFNYASILALSAVCLLGMGMAYYFSGKALKPVQELNRAIAEISEDNLQQRISVKNKGDEISNLTESFNLMLERLEESFWRQKRFASNAAHELKTPLAVMKTGLQMLELYDSLGDEEYKETADIMKRQTDRLIGVVNDLMIMTNQGYEEERKKVHLQGLINTIVEELKPICTDKGITIEINGVQDELCTECGGNMAYIVFYNLIENAIKYNRDNGRISVDVFTRLKGENEQVCVRIQDSGQGIAEEEMKKIFEPFYCVDPSRTKKLGGSGLGLAIVKDIIQRYEWSIEGESTVDVGTAFVVTMPVYS